MKKITLVALLVSSALFAGMNQNARSFSDFDVDGNGKITQSEFDNTQERNMLANKNAGYPMQNANNRPTFSMFDTNQDGSIDANEFSMKQQTNMQGNMSQKSNKVRGQGMKNNMNGANFAQKGMNQNAHSFSEFDVDGNGKVTQSEYENAQQRNISANKNAGKLMRNADNRPNFNMVDTNKDGYIDANELTIQQQKNMQKNRNF